MTPAEAAERERNLLWALGAPLAALREAGVPIGIRREAIRCRFGILPPDLVDRAEELAVRVQGEREVATPLAIED